MRKYFHVAIVGGRDFADFDRLVAVMDNLLTIRRKEQTIVVHCGMARGADSLGEEYARLRGYSVTYFKPHWDEFGKRAGYIRNEVMSDASDAVVAFWDGASRGTKHMIEYSEKQGKPVRVIRYENQTPVNRGISNLGNRPRSGGSGNQEFIEQKFRKELQREARIVQNLIHG